MFSYTKNKLSQDDEQLLKNRKIQYILVDDILTSQLPPVIIKEQNIKQFKRGINIDYCKTFTNQYRQKQLNKYEFYNFPLIKDYTICLTGFKSKHEDKILYTNLVKSMGANIIHIKTLGDILNILNKEKTYIFVYQPNLLLKLLNKLDKDKINILLEKIRSIRLLEFIFANSIGQDSIDQAFQIQSYHLQLIENITVYNQIDYGSNHSFNFIFTSKNPENYKFKTVSQQDLEKNFIIKDNLYLPKNYSKNEVIITNQSLKSLAFQNIQLYKLKALYEKPLIISAKDYQSIVQLIQKFGAEQQQQEFLNQFLYVPYEEIENIKDLAFKIIIIQNDSNDMDDYKDAITIKNNFYLITVYLEYLFKCVKQHQKIEQSHFYYYMIDSSNKTLENICSMDGEQINNIKKCGLKQQNIIDLIKECFNVDKLTQQDQDKLIDCLADQIGFQANISTNSSLFSVDNANTIFLFNSLAETYFNINSLIKQQQQSQSNTLEGNNIFSSTVKEESQPSQEYSESDQYNDYDYYQPQQDAYFKLI